MNSSRCDSRRTAGTCESGGTCREASNSTSRIPSSGPSASHSEPGRHPPPSEWTASAGAREPQQFKLKLQDLVGFFVHMGELLDGKPTNHLDLRKDLARTKASDFLYYRVVTE